MALIIVIIPGWCLLIESVEYNFNAEYAVTKDIYNALTAKKHVTPSAVEIWNLQFNIDHSQIAQIYKLPYICIMGATLQSFQCKILHIIIYTMKKTTVTAYILPKDLRTVSRDENSSGHLQIDQCRQPTAKQGCTNISNTEYIHLKIT